MCVVYLIYLLFCSVGKGEVYFADRDYSIFSAPDVEFKDKNNLNVNLKDTLLDGVSVLLMVY